MTRFQSRADGEYVQCPNCARAGYGVDSWHPATPEFWSVLHGQLQFHKCRACRSEVAARKFGMVPEWRAAA